MSKVKKPRKTWRCFHCDEVFKSRKAAAEHFGEGNYEAEIPLCVEAASTEQKQLILTNREMWETIQKAEGEIESLEDRLNHFEYVTRKLTKKPSGTAHDLEHEFDFMQGLIIAAEAKANGQDFTH